MSHKQELQDQLIELADKHFPKGKSKERGEAMVLVAEAIQSIETYTANKIKEAEERIWAGVHTKHQVGDVVGYYKIVERFKKVGKNTKYRVVCTICGEPMFRYSNKFKLHHKDCHDHLKQNKKED